MADQDLSSEELAELFAEDLELDWEVSQIPSKPIPENVKEEQYQLSAKELDEVIANYFAEAKDSAEELDEVIADYFAEAKDRMDEEQIIDVQLSRELDIQADLGPEFYFPEGDFYDVELYYAFKNDMRLDGRSPFLEPSARAALSARVAQTMPSGEKARLDAALRQAKVEWYLNFNAEPYTSFWMFDHLIQAAGISYAQFLKDPAILRRKYLQRNVSEPLTGDWKEHANYKGTVDEIRQIEDAIKKTNLEGLIKEPGRCTTFAIQMAKSLEAIPGLEFEFHDTGGHRLARCKSTGILLDSSVKGSPFFLPNSRWKTIKSGRGTQEFRYSSGISETKTTNRQGRLIHKKSAGGISIEKSIVNCLREIVVEDGSFMFTDEATGQAETRYHGMVKVLFQGLSQDQTQPKSRKGINRVHTLEVRLHSQNPKNENGLNTTAFVWDRGNTPEDENACAAALRSFVSSYGGYHGESQWLKCIPIFDAIWEAANSIWGHPRIKEDDQTIPDRTGRGLGSSMPPRGRYLSSRGRYPTRGNRAQ